MDIYNYSLDVNSFSVNTSVNTLEVPPSDFATEEIVGNPGLTCPSSLSDGFVSQHSLDGIAPNFIQNGEETTSDTQNVKISNDTHNENTPANHSFLCQEPQIIPEDPIPIPGAHDNTAIFTPINQCRDDNIIPICSNEDIDPTVTVNIDDIHNLPLHVNEQREETSSAQLATPSLQDIHVTGMNVFQVDTNKDDSIVHQSHTLEDSLYSMHNVSHVESTALEQSKPLISTAVQIEIDSLACPHLGQQDLKLASTPSEVMLEPQSSPRALDTNTSPLLQASQPDNIGLSDLQGLGHAEPISGNALQEPLKSAMAIPTPVNLLDITPPDLTSSESSVNGTSPPPPPNSASPDIGNLHHPTYRMTVSNRTHLRQTPLLNQLPM